MASTANSSAAGNGSGGDGDGDGVGANLRVLPPSPNWYCSQVSLTTMLYAPNGRMRVH